MADALCGPSNALQTLQKQTQVDRTLQQDRLAFRPQQNENFRSSPGPSNGALDAEFEAFQTGQPVGAPMMQQQQHIPFAHHQPLQQQQQHHNAPIAQPGLPAWATDFQQLNIHEARQSPIPAARFRHEAPLQRSSGTSWHAEFLRQDSGLGGNNRTATPPQQQSAFGPSFGGQPSYMTSPPMMGAGFGGMGSFAGSMHLQQQQQQGVAAKTSQVDMFDDAAFAAAFDSAAAIVSRPEQQQQQVRDKGKAKEQDARAAAAAESEQEQFSLDHACVEAPEPFFADVDEEALAEGQTWNTGQQEAGSGMFNQSSIAHDTPPGGLEDLTKPDLDGPLTHPLDGVHHTDRMVDEEDQQQRTDPGAEADELSRTAGQLLDNLKHEQGEKFANSNFMALMRQLRDREVKVEGDNFVEVSHALEPDLGSLGEFSTRDWM